MTHVDYCRQFLSKNSSVLDIGSGRGKFLCEVAKYCNNVYGVEISQHYIHESKILAQTAGVKINVREAKAEELPFADANFDFINCAEVTEHVEDPTRVCREIFRVLRPEGKCYISFHNRFGIYDYHYHLYFINWIPRSWTEYILRLLKKQKGDGSAVGRQKLTTMHYYTYKKARNLLNDSGFYITDIRAEKIKKKFKYSAPIFLPIYFFILKPFYFNTFHFLLEKK